MQAEISDPALAHGHGVAFPGRSQRSLRSRVEDESRIVATEYPCVAMALSSHRKGSLVRRRDTDTMIPVVGHREAHLCPAVQCKLHSGCFRSTLWVLILPSLTRACSVGHCAVTGVGKARQTHGAFAPFEVEQAGIRATAEQIRSSGST